MVSLVAVLGLATIATAAPFMTERDLNSTVWTPDHVLQQDEVILYGQGRMEVVHISIYEKLLEFQGVSTETPEIDQEFLDSGKQFENVNVERDEAHSLDARQASCSGTTSYVTDTTQRFVDWDAQMSPVVIGQGRNGIDVSVASSFSVANSVSVSGGLDLKVVKDRLGASLGVNFSRTWTTQATITVKGTVFPGETGVVITRPWKNRRYGRAFRGCPGSLQQTGTWMADSFEEGSYEGVKWVSGAITMCIKKQSGLPLTRCHDALAIINLVPIRMDNGGRRYSPKVKTGCLVCRRRKVKCDEGKPSCVRCTSAGRTCQYNQPISTLACYRPRQFTSHDQGEGRAFKYFSSVISPALSGPQDGFFWTHVVMQFGHFSPAVRHAILAISSLYEDFSGGKRITDETAGENLFALRHYNASVQHIRTTDDENLTLLTCVLFLCIDVLMGNMHSAHRHRAYGTAILTSKKRAPDWATDHLLPVFRRLSAGPQPGGPGRRRHHPPQPITQPFSPSTYELERGEGPFTSLAEAEATLVNVRIQSARFGFFAAVKPDPDVLKERIQCLEALDTWMANFTELMITNPPTSHADSLTFIYLHMIYQILAIAVDVAAEESETAFDRHIPSFRAIVTLAEGAAALKSSLPEARQRPCFIFEEGFLLPLSFTAHKCRDLPTRLRALELTGVLAAPKEGFVDTGTVYRMTRRVVEVEHGMSMKEAAYIARLQAVPLPPEEDRILFIAPDPRLHVDHGPGGQKAYYRIAKMFVRSPDGPRVYRTERINDDPASPGIPGLRSALT
ncbi:Aspercryptin biosynthesis cluster-specific transcription regulator atnN [Paramyrothecium foliicola]|nr:Aspercryptin biosynthesis cluster-specific transcription regulator atnN [Paramyrothecium foliicola]